MSSQVPTKRGRPAKITKQRGSVVQKSQSESKVMNEEDIKISKTSSLKITRQTMVNSSTVDEGTLRNRFENDDSTSVLKKVRDQLICEVEEIQKKVIFSLRNKELEIEELVNKNNELAKNNNGFLERNKILENDNKALTRKIQLMVDKKDVSVLQGERDMVNIKLQEKEEKLTKLVNLIEPLRKKVKEQETLREQLNQASGEIKSLHVVNEEFKKELAGSKKEQEAVEKKEKELDSLKLKAEAFLEKSKKSICDEKSRLQKDWQIFKDQKKKLEDEKLKVQEEQVRLGQDSKSLEKLKLQVNEERQFIDEEKKAIEDDKIMLDNEWGDIMKKKEELENQANLPEVHMEVMKQKEDQLEKVFIENKLLQAQIESRETKHKDLILKHDLLTEELGAMKEGFKKEVADMNAKCVEANLSKELLDNELRSKAKTVVCLQGELSSSKQDLEKRIEAYKLNQGKLSRTIIKQKEEEIDKLKQHISELVSTKKRKQESETDNDVSKAKKIKPSVRSEASTIVRELSNIAEENNEEYNSTSFNINQDNPVEGTDQNFIAGSSVESSTNTPEDQNALTASGEVKDSSALKLLDDFESFLKSSRNKTQQKVKELTNSAGDEEIEPVDDHNVLVDQSVKKSNEITKKVDQLIQQTDLISSTGAVSEQKMKSVRDIFDSDSEEDTDSESHPTTSKEGTESSSVQKCAPNSQPMMLTSSQPPPPSFTPEPPHLSPPIVSNSPAQTSNRPSQDKPLITVRDINTMSSFLGQDVIIPNLADSIIAPIDMSEDHAKEKELETRNIEREVERNLKFQVAGVVKNCLNKFYKNSVYAIQTREEFEALAAEFSTQFREDIMATYMLSHSSLAGLVMSSEDRTSIIDQIIFYFQIKKTVNDHLCKHFPPNSSQFISNLSKFTNQFSSEIKESYRMMHNSLVGIAITLDNDLWIKTKIDFIISDINSN